jgi:endonuclease/exonuclease/phosphatase (EEP) superfamily protein YafD
MGHNRRYDLLIAQARAERPDVLVIQECTPQWWANLQPLRAEYPHTQAVVQFGGGGMAVLSRFPLANAETRKVDESTHKIITADVLAGSVAVKLLALHLRTPTTPRGFVFRNSQLAWAAAYMNRQPGPKLLIGDLNTTPFSPYFRDFEQSTGLRNVRRGWGLLPSWSPWRVSSFAAPSFLSIPIDHCLVSEEIKVARARLGRPVGSDHLPLIVELVVEN